MLPCVGPACAPSPSHVTDTRLPPAPRAACDPRDLFNSWSWYLNPLHPSVPHQSGLRVREAGFVVVSTCK